ncbi:MAG TPA: glycerophosphodiester phosphodiesterase family protein [Gammaproteobacteria bacterium]|nr:glycerophosphodiester phosphodiesterase family protein [Gammaproteobacteria bacterium]
MTQPSRTVIAHRGASGYLPEHTLAGYAMAHAMGADFLEPDLVMTRDGVLIARHDVILEDTTDIAAVFPDRSRADGHWYAADFELAEIRRLQARERTEHRFRRDSHGFPVPTFEELLQLVAELNRLTGRGTGVYPETKEPDFHRAAGLPMEEPLLALLERYRYREAADPVFVQSFDPENLRHMRESLGTKLRLVQLVSDAASVTPGGLDTVAAYADAIGPDRRLIDPDDAGDAPGPRLVQDAHARGLLVHPYTFRADAVDPRYADFESELRRFCFEFGVDGVFSDHPDRATAVLHTAPDR